MYIYIYIYIYIYDTRSVFLMNRINITSTQVKRKTFAARSFSIMAPSLWNELPDFLGRPIVWKSLKLN